MNKIFMPFPGRELANEELSRDSCCGKVPECDRPIITDKAWLKGTKAAELIFGRYRGETDFMRIIEKSGLTCKKIDTDYVMGNQRYFSDYLTGQKLIHLYMKSISLWAEENEMELDEAVNLILSHEYYHFLEWSELGLTSKDYQVPMLKLGGLKIGRTGIRALSEIGAHGFAFRYHQLANNLQECPSASETGQERRKEEVYETEFEL
ncbi:hypothetical protein AALB39_28195 [Lachnospiraceae bacterium 54-53]